MCETCCFVIVSSGWQCLIRDAYIVLLKARLTALLLHRCDIFKTAAETVQHSTKPEDDQAKHEDIWVGRPILSTEAEPFQENQLVGSG